MSMVGIHQAPSCGQASRRRSQPTEGYNLSFGQYLVEPLDEVYLQWMLKNIPESSAWRNAAADVRGKMKKQAEKVIYNVHTLLTDLKSCSLRRDLQWGRRIHSKAVESRDDWSMCVMTAFIRMYSKCGSMVDARRVFDTIHIPDVVAWNVLLLGYAENGDGLIALDLFLKMKCCRCTPDSVTYVAIVKACTSMAQKKDRIECLKLGKEIHSEIGYRLNIFVHNTLIDMYSNFGSMADAQRVFDDIQKPNVVSWNALLLGYTQNGESLLTLKLFSRMKRCGCAPNSVTYVAVLKTLAVSQDGDKRGECLKRGKEIHSEIGCHLNIFVECMLIEMYANCGSMKDARCVFDSIQRPDVACWNSILLGYVQNGNGLETLELYSKMKACGCVPTSLTYIATLKACGLIGALALARKFHLEIREFTAHVVTCLVDCYAKCGSIIEAHEVFDAHSRVRDIWTWTALLTGYGSFGDTTSVFQLFDIMQDQGYQPNVVTFLCVLSCCSRAGLVEKARTYLEAMSMHYRITPTVMHYTCIVDVLCRGNHLKEAIDVVQKMPCNPDEVTWMTLLSACRKWKNVEIGRYAFRYLLDMDKRNALAYFLMAQIYGSRGLWQEQERVLKELDDWKISKQC